MRFVVVVVVLELLYFSVFFFFFFFFFPRARVSVKKRSSSRKFRTNRFRTIRFDDEDGGRKRRERERESLSRGGANLPSTLSSARMDGFFLGRERRKSAHKDGRERERKAKTTLGSLSLSLSLSLVFWVNRIRARIALVLTLEMLFSLCITYEGIFQEKSTKDEDTYCVFVDDAVPGRFADAVFCIFDGHAGKLSAQRCAEEFMQRICDGLPENEKLNASVNNNDNGNKESSNTRRKSTNEQKGNGEDNAQLGNHDILLDDRENAKQIWPKSLEQATRDAAAKINHDMRVHGRDGTTALIVMIKRDLHTNIAYVKTAWVGDTRAVIRYKNRTFNLSEDHTVMNLNERSRMGQYYRSRAKKSRVLQQKADELKSPLNRRKRNTSVEDFGTDSSNPSIEGGLAFKEWQEKTQAEKEESIRGGSEMLTRFAGGRRASEVLKSRQDSFTQTSEKVKEKEYERTKTQSPPPTMTTTTTLTSAGSSKGMIKVLKSNSNVELRNLEVNRVENLTLESDLTQAQGAANAAAKLADLSLKIPKEDARKELKRVQAKHEEKGIKKAIRSLAAKASQDEPSSMDKTHTGSDYSSTTGSSAGTKSSSFPYSSSSEELEDWRREPPKTQNFGGQGSDDVDNDIYSTLFPFKIEDIPRVHIDKSGLVSSMHSRRTSFLARIEHEETGGLSAPRIVARTGVSCAFTRSIGDSGVSRCVICTPEFRDFTIACGEPARIVLASDGCWDVFTSDEATLHVESLRDADYTRTSDYSTKGGAFHNTATVDASVRDESNHSASDVSSRKDGGGIYADLSVRFGQNSSFQESAPGIPAAQAAKKLAKSAKQRRLYRSYPPDDITVIVVDINLAHFEVVDQPGCSCVVS